MQKPSVRTGGIIKLSFLVALSVFFLNNVVNAADETVNGNLTVTKQIKGGFGAQTTTGTLDWNDISNRTSSNGYTLLLGTASNGPGPNTYFHPFNFEYSSKDGSGNITQFAIPYGLYTRIGIYIRGCYGGTWYPWMKILSEDHNGNVGIGTTNPSKKLHVVGNVTLDVDGAGAFTFDTYQNSSRLYCGAVPILFQSNNVGGALASFTASGTPKVTILYDGNVGIGTSSPQSKLAVNGTITTKEVNVTDTGWSDYVFEKNYHLRSLDEVETHIKQHKHLPDIPSAKEIEKNGLNMAEMMAKQMQKIEELTLYVIEQNKKIEQIIIENKKLKQQVHELKTVKH